MWVNVPESPHGRCDTKLFCLIKVGIRREVMLGSYHEPVVP